MPVTKEDRIAKAMIPAQEQVIKMHKQDDIAACESKFMGEMPRANENVKAMSGFGGFFRDPFGIQRHRYRRELAAVEADRQGCLARAEKKATQATEELHATDKANR